MSKIEITKKQMSTAQARKAVDRARVYVEGLRIAIAEMYLGGADRALGYESWEDFVTAEFADLGLALPRENRRVVVDSLADMGYPTRAIAAAVGVTHTTVVDDLRRKNSSSQDPTPEAEEEPEEVVEAEIVEDDEPPPPRTGRAPRTDVVGTMNAVWARSLEAAEKAVVIKPEHFRGKPEDAERWYRTLAPSVEQLNELLALLQKATK